MSIIKGTNQIVAGFGGTKRSIGEVYFSQSSLASDNSGALPLFTGETIASANTIYPDFYNWVLAHTELQCTSAEYESALSTYGECAKYVVINSTPTRYKWENLLTGTLYTLSRNPAVGDLAYDVTGNSSWPITEASSTEIVVPTFADNKPLSYVEEVAGTSASLRLPKLSNYIKAANTAEGIKNIEAGLPNITGDFNVGGAWTRYASGAFKVPTAEVGGDGPAGNGSSQTRYTFDASRSSTIYGKSSTVTPASTTLYPWVVAYTAAIPASTAQAAEFQQALSGKADTNLANVQIATKAALLDLLAMDTTRGVSLPSGTTLTKNGWIVCSFTDSSYGVAQFKINGVTTFQWSFQSAANTRQGTCYGGKGQVFTITTSGTCTAVATFYPLKGE